MQYNRNVLDGIRRMRLLIPAYETAEMSDHIENRDFYEKMWNRETRNLPSSRRTYDEFSESEFDSDTASLRQRKLARLSLKLDEVDRKRRMAARKYWMK